MLQRTQIYLPEDLRREIDKLRKDANKSLAEYTRVALEEKVKKDKKKKADLKTLADMIRKMKSTRTKKEAEEWIKEIKEDRRLSDERLERRWVEASKKANVHTIVTFLSWVLWGLRERKNSYLKL